MVEVTSDYHGKLPTLPLLGAFFSGELPQSQIVCLRGNVEGPLGYIFNTSLAFERDKSQPEVSWFSGVAISAGHWALSNLDQPTLKRVFELQQPTVSHQDVFDDSVCIAVLRRTESARCDLLQFEQIDHQLFSLGFVRGSAKTQTNPQNFAEAVEEQIDCTGNVDLSILPINTKHLRFISETFTQHIPLNHNPLMHFFFYYQLIELMLEEISAQKIAESVDRLINSKSSSIRTRVRDEAQKLQAALKEASNINNLFSIAGPQRADLEDLKTTISKAIDPEEKIKDNSIADHLYLLRNLLFHNYRGPESISSIKLSGINSALRRIIPKLISSIFVENLHRNNRDARETPTISSIYDLNFPHLCSQTKDLD